MAYRRRLYQLIAVVYLAALLGCISLVLGPFLNDRAIAAHPGRALAEVTGVSLTRTTVEFQDASGIYHAPETGLLYPGGLGEGQKVWVAFDTANPDIVKVENRGWTLAIIPATSVAAVATLIAALLSAVVWFTGNAPKRRSLPKQPITPREPRSQ